MFMPQLVVLGIDQTSQLMAEIEAEGKPSHLSCLKCHHSHLTAWF